MNKTAENRSFQCYHTAYSSPLKAYHSFIILSHLDLLTFNNYNLYIISSAFNFACTLRWVGKAFIYYNGNSTMYSVNTSLDNKSTSPKLSFTNCGIVITNKVA